MKQLFLLEDDMSLISGLSFAVKKQGYEIDVARTTLEADTLWENSKYDLAILDVSLPDGSGFDFCKKIRSTSKVQNIFPGTKKLPLNVTMKASYTDCSMKLIL